MLPTARCYSVPRCPSQAAIVCHDAHRNVSLRAYVAHCKLPSCCMLPIASDHHMACCPSHINMPLCSCVAHCMVPWEVIAWFPHVLSFPSHGAIVCLCSPCQSAIVCLYHPLRVPLVVPKVFHRMGYPPSAKGGYPMIPMRAKLPM